MNYTIITDEEKLKEFIDMLPDNSKDERYMMYLFARNKYNPIEGLTADKCQLKRIMCHKKDIVSNLRGLEIKEGSYTFGDIILPQDNLVVYIQPNPRCLKKAARKTQTEIVNNLLDGGNLNVKSLFYNNLQISPAEKKYFMLDVDWNVSYSELECNLLKNELILALGFQPLMLKSKNGVHVLVETDRIVENKKSKWYNLVRDISNDNFQITMSSDNMCVIAGAVQANFSPYIIR